MKRISIIRTSGELDYLEEKIKAMGRQNLNRYMQSELRKMSKIYQDCPECISPAFGGRREKKIPLEGDVEEMLIDLSVRTGRPIKSILDDLIIAPLLQPEKASTLYRPPSRY